VRGQRRGVMPAWAGLVPPLGRLGGQGSWSPPKASGGRSPAIRRELRLGPRRRGIAQKSPLNRTPTR
jgi:hypothetical protein